ncbi:hypothetical protein [Amycolatopsis sp. NPDC059657]|uniref:hypothetical protein n=1 Tax=Amycolatopsis sp. NPDC059657 TaxID=3346899 RepID=UPI00366EA426
MVTEIDHLRTQNRIAKWALFVAALALLVGAGGYYWNFRQIKEAQTQFDLSGPSLTYDMGVSLAYADPAKGTNAWFDKRQAPPLTNAIFAKYDQVWLRIALINEGRLETTLTGARLQLGPTSWLTHDSAKARTWCTVDKGRMVDCGQALPMRLAPGQRYYIYFPLHDVRKDMTHIPSPEPSVIVEITATGRRTPTETLPTGIVMADLP